MSVLKYFWWRYLHRPVRVWCHFLSRDMVVRRQKCLITYAEYSLRRISDGERKVCFSTGYVNAVDEQGYSTRYIAVGYEPFTYRIADVFPVTYPSQMSTAALLMTAMDDTFMRSLMQSVAHESWSTRFWRRFFDSEELPGEAKSSYTPYGLLYEKCLRKGVVDSSLTFEEFTELVGLMEDEIDNMQTV